MNKLMKKLGLDTGISFDTPPAGAGGGGPAAAGAPGGSGGAPASSPAPAPAPAAPATPPAPSVGAKPGIFGGVQTVPLNALPGAPAAPVQPPAAPAAIPPTEALPPTGAAAAIEGAFSKPMMGRYNNFTEAEEAMRRSQDEGLRLHQENKTLREGSARDIAQRDAQLTSLRTELELARSTPGFTEMSKEALEELAKENPVAAAEYVAEKKFRDRDTQFNKERIEREEREHLEMQESMLRDISKRDIEMRSNPIEYPQYAEMLPIVDQFIDLTRVGKYSPLTGHAWSGEILYYTALGHSYLQALKAGKGAQVDAASAAAAKAAADAAAAAGSAGGAGGGSAGAGGDAAAKETAEYKQSVLANAPRRVFGGKA